MQTYFIIWVPMSSADLASDYIMKICVWAGLNMSFHISVLFLCSFAILLFCSFSCCTSSLPTPFLCFYLYSLLSTWIFFPPPHFNIFTHLFCARYCSKCFTFRNSAIFNWCTAKIFKHCNIWLYVIRTLTSFLLDG